MKVLGYRIAMLVSGGLALILADGWLGWGNTYVLMGALMAVGVLATLWAPEPELPGGGAAQPGPMPCRTRCGGVLRGAAPSAC